MQVSGGYKHIMFDKVSFVPGGSKRPVLRVLQPTATKARVKCEEGSFAALRMTRALGYAPTLRRLESLCDEVAPERNCAYVGMSAGTCGGRKFHTWVRKIFGGGVAGYFCPRSARTTPTITRAVPRSRWLEGWSPRKRAARRMTTTGWK
jgi:hypothetical protein